MVNLLGNHQTQTSIAAAAAPTINSYNTISNSDSNYSISNSNNSNGTANNNMHNANILDNTSVSRCKNSSNNINTVKTNQMNNANRNQNVNANGNVENYRPTYGAYITNILPRGPYLQYKFNDQQQQQQQQQGRDNQQQPTANKSHLNDNNDHFSHHQHHPNFASYMHHNHQQQTKPNQIIRHQEYQLIPEAVSEATDFRSLPYATNGNPLSSNDQLSNYQHGYAIQCQPTASGPNRSGTNPGRGVDNATNSSQHCFRNSNANGMDLKNQRSSIYQQAPNRYVRSGSNPSLYSSGSGQDPGCGLTMTRNINWHPISARSNGSQTSGSCDKILASKGYQTLPHKLKSGQGGRTGREGNIYIQRHSPDHAKSNQTHIKNSNLAASSASIAGPSNDFLQQIKQKNSNMLARMSATLAKNYSRTFSQQEIRYSQASRAASDLDGGVGGGNMTTQPCRPTNALTSQINCVTLEDVMHLKPGGLSDFEGWALLCQTVQALQDLFLTDTPSTLRILPLVRPSTIQITSRGRVVFVVTTTLGPTSSSSSTTLGQLDKFNDTDLLPCHDIAAHLAPEFLSAIDKKVAFAESDIEKMWIYSLGITLRKTIRGHPLQQQQKLHERNNEQHQPPLPYDNSPVPAINSNVMPIARCTYEKHNYRYQHNDPNTNGDAMVTGSINGDGYGGFIASHVRPPHSRCNAYNSLQCALDISLDQVLGCMCEPNLHHRASLMYLLDVISKFCRNQLQAKPFSHIVMELFAEITSQPERDCDEPVVRNTLKTVDGSRSETDSGRSSAHGDKDSDANGHYDCQNQVVPASTLNDFNYIFNNQQNLRVIRNRPTENMDYPKFGTIGYAGVKTLLMQKKDASRAPALQVLRRTKEGVLKRKNSFRRNTIDINLFDLEKARQENFHVEEKNDLNKSKSTNCIDQIDDDNDDAANVDGRGDGLKRIKKVSAKKMENGLSMPDLNSHKIMSLPNQQPKNYRLKSFEALTKAYSEDSFWIKPNGPEFIVKSSLPSREIELVETKCQHRKVVSVLLLNGQSLHIACNSLTTTAQQIFEAVIRSENFVENFFIGLCALIGGDFVFLPNDLKIYKVAPQIWINVSKKTNNIDNVFFTLFLRIKFFLPTLRGISSLESRHMLYLQLRKSILEKHILCTDDDLITLGGLALQAEVGNFKQSMKYSDYFTISHYLPEGVYQRNKEMAKYLRNSHYCRQGLHPKEAEQNFIKYIQDMKEYGFHLYSAVWTADDTTLIDVYVGISLAGIALFERNRQPQANPVANSKTSYQRKLYMSFEWLEIENLCFSKHILCIVVRKTESLKAKDNNRIKYKLKMDGRKSYFAFSLASEHHQFYMKLRNSFISLKTLSDKLNIPIASATMRTTASDPNSIGAEGQFKGIDTKSVRTQSEKHNNVAVAIDKVQDDAEIDANKENCETDANRANIKNNGKSGSGSGVGGIGSGIQENIKKIDKQLKASGLRVRNLKKSMLNDNRLIKLKQRFLRRSKSTVGSTSCPSSSVENCRGAETVAANGDANANEKKNDNNKKLVAALATKPTDKDNNFPVAENNDDKDNCGRSKEENQNMENECPRVLSPTNDLEPRIYSPNRNRVKMGTRVFSTQFLNKSYDNIYDRTLNLYRFESANSINNDLCENNLEAFRSDALRRTADDGLSIRSASLNSLYSSEKILNCDPDLLPGNEAYVIDSSIKSEHEINNIILQNETVSESLMEKFNNISGNNTVTDRIIIKVTIVKERFSKNPYRIEQINQQYLSNNNSRSSSNCSPPNQKHDLIFNANTAKQLTKNNRWSQCESIKYATFNQKRAKEYSTTTTMMSDCVNNRNIDTYNIKENTEYMNKALWHLSRSQESIFINNKFPVRNECIAVNQSNTNGTNSNGNINSNGIGGSHGSNSRGNNYITKEIPSSASSSSSSTGTMCGNGRELSEYTLGISIVQGSDNNVYVKDLVKNGPAEKSGIRIGDQIIAVNGISLLNLSYIESLRLLQNTGLIVELQVSQIFNKNKNSSKPSSLAPARKSQKDNENLVVSRRVSSSIAKLNYAGNDRRNLNSIVTNHCDEYLKRLRRERQDALERNKQEVDVRLSRDGTTNKMKANCRTAEKDVDEIGVVETVKRIGSFDMASDNIRATRDKFKSLRNVNGNLCALSPAKSMPDLPKVVAIIPKPDPHFDDEAHQEKRQVTRTASQSRKYLGPVRYPVTPIKTVLSPVRHQLSLLADSDDEQVFI